MHPSTTDKHLQPRAAASRYKSGSPRAASLPRRSIIMPQRPCRRGKGLYRDLTQRIHFHRQRCQRLRVHDRQHRPSLDHHHLHSHGGRLKTMRLAGKVRPLARQDVSAGGDVGNPSSPGCTRPGEHQGWSCRWQLVQGLRATSVGGRLVRRCVCPPWESDRDSHALSQRPLRFDPERLVPFQPVYFHLRVQAIFPTTSSASTNLGA